MRVSPGLLGVLLLSGCAVPERDETRVIARHALVRVERIETQVGTLVRLVPAKGAQLNARLAPALELRDTVLYFSGNSVTADSAYFVQPPTLQLSRDKGTIAGTVRASICPASQRVCVIIELPVRARL